MRYGSELTHAQTPDEIASRIAHTRQELDRKLHKIGERLDPHVRLEELKAGVSARAPKYLAWGAVGAIAAGSWMAVRGWNHRNGSDSDLYLSPDHPLLAEGGID